MGSSNSSAEQNSPTTMTFAAETATINAARGFVTDLLAAYHAGPTLLQNAELIASELASNAIAAATGRSYSITVRREQTDSIVIVVTNATAGEAPPDREEWEPKVALASLGRGLGIVEHIARDLRVEDSGVEMRISARLDWEAA